MTTIAKEFESLEALDIVIIVLAKDDQLVTTHLYGTDHSIEDIRTFMALDYNEYEIINVIK